jgi:ankyrin repeat protein
MLPNPYLRQPVETDPSSLPLSPQAFGNSLLYQAINHTNERDGTAMIDIALRLGAQLNSHSCYECNALVMAVRSNKPWSISILMMRGAELPQPCVDGVNLLMEVCRDGHIEMAMALIDYAKMNVNAVDYSGKTSLHYAAIGGHDKVATLLLEYGAAPDAPACALSETEIQSIFGHGITLYGKVVTPLMIAVSLGHELLASSLLAVGANPNAGAYSPLIIAALRHHESLFDNLLASGATLGNCKGPDDTAGLIACIASRIPINFLSKLITQHDFSVDDGTVESPLGYAISSNDTDTIALLLASGAPVENHLQSDEPLTIWDLALNSNKFSSVASDMLTARIPRNIDSGDLHQMTGLLQELVKYCNNPARLASTGVFTSPLIPAKEDLMILNQVASQLKYSQCALEAAQLLSKYFPISENNLATQVPNYEIGSFTPKKYWLQRTAGKILEQKIQIAKVCTTLIGHYMHELQEATSLPFFLKCAIECPDDQSMHGFVKHRIIDTSGAPDSVARLVRNPWIIAAQWTKDWQVAQQSDEEASRFLLALAQNLMRKAIDEFDGNHTELIDRCLSVLREALPLESHPLSEFCANPVNWIMNLEKRSSLADPEDTLPHQIQIELGLPLASCTAIVLIWKRSLEKLRIAKSQSPDTLQPSLSHQMALDISAALMSEGGEKIVPPTSLLILQNWRTKVLSTRPASQAARKRPADSEASGAPPRKEARDS